MMRRLLPTCLLLLAASLPAAGEPQKLLPAGARPRIVNGVTTTSYPSTVAILGAVDNLVYCSGTLIGCKTVLTAAHCVCVEDGTGADCQPGGPNRVPASQLLVYAQHGGIYDVTAIKVPQDYVFASESDVALLTLGEEVNGISPARINIQMSPPHGTTGTIVGFGQSDGNVEDFGLKRAGQVVTAACLTATEAPHVCWRFADPVGAIGLDSNTCSGDSGGSLFMDLGQGPVLAGVTSGGISDDCQPLDDSWDANVYYEREWLTINGGVDLGNTSCGPLPEAGGPNAPIFSGEATVSASNPEREFTFDVPAGATAFRVTLNAEEGSFSSLTDVDLFLRAGSPPTTAAYDCSSERSGVYEVCEVLAPAEGPWNVLVHRYAGQGKVQVTATIFGVEPSGSCQNDATTLCIDDQPGDERFRITVDVDTALGRGFKGHGKAIPLSPLGIRRGGLFWFFDLSNPELLLKVLNGCKTNGNYWVFWSAGTNVGMTVRVEDTTTGQSVTYTNPDGKVAAPVTDTAAFPCDGS